MIAILMEAGNLLCHIIHYRLPSIIRVFFLLEKVSSQLGSQTLLNYFARIH